MKQVRQFTNRYIAASPTVKRNLVSKYGIEDANIEILDSFLPPPKKLPTRTEVTDLAKSLQIEDDDIIIISSGFESWRKGQDIFVELGCRLCQIKPNVRWKLLWIGGWESNADRKRLHRMVAESGLQRRILFLGEVENPMTYFALGNVFVLTSREEPLRLVALEASLLGVPIICFDEAGGMSDFVSSDAGISVPYLDTDAMAAAVIRLVNEPETALRFNRRAKKKFEQRHSVGTGARAMVDCVQNVYLQHKWLSNASQPY